MRRKEIFFKKLSFIIGVVLIISLVAGTEVTLPLRSEIRFLQGSNGWGAIQSEFIIQQEDNEINIELFKDIINRWTGVIREGIISVSEYKAFWDSLFTLNFWQLNKEYDEPKKEGEIVVTDGATEGSISVSYEKIGGDKITKIIRYREPQYCPVEFQRIYGLLIGMDSFARYPPNLESILKYAEGDNNWYKKLAIREMGRIKDPKYLDTLLILLSTEKNYSFSILSSLSYIGDKKAIPVLYQYLKNLDSLEIPRELSFYPYFLSRELLIINTLNSIATIQGNKSVPILKKYLGEKYDPSTKEKVSLMLIKFNDYRGVPILINYIKEHGLNDDELIKLKESCNENKRVIDALVKELGVEARKKEPNDKIIAELIKGLSKITEQNYPYNPSDSLTVKKETINKWINWWKENKDKFK